MIPTSGTQTPHMGGGQDARPWRSPDLGLLPLVALLPVLVAQALPAAAQPAPVPPAAAAAAPGQATAAPLTAVQLDRLLDPFAGAPQDVLAVVLDACRYPRRRRSVRHSCPA
jgi:hypothetical protein